MSVNLNWDEVRRLLEDLYQATDRLEELFPGRKFTLDGHLVGSLGITGITGTAYQLQNSQSGYYGDSITGTAYQLQNSQSHRDFAPDEGEVSGDDDPGTHKLLWPHRPACFETAQERLLSMRTIEACAGVSE